MKTVKVKDLKVGDELTSCTVIEAPFDSVRCPAGKTNLTVRYHSGAIREVQWSKGTDVKIKA